MGQLGGGQILQRRSAFSGKCDGWSSDDFLALGANRETVRTVRMWWPWVGQVPGRRKHRVDISHKLSDSCSWVFCEISAVRQESQKKLKGRKGSRKTQEVSVSYSWMNSPWAPGEVSEGRWLSLRWVNSELRKDQAARAWAAGRHIISSNSIISACRKGVLCLLPSPWKVDASLWLPLGNG